MLHFEWFLKILQRYGVCCLKDCLWRCGCTILMHTCSHEWPQIPRMHVWNIHHREDSPITQTTPEATLLSLGGWPREQIPPPTPGHTTKPGLIALITGINPEAFKWGVDRYDRLLCPGLQPGPPSQTPGSLGQRYWCVSEVTWLPQMELRRWRSSGPSSVMYQVTQTPLFSNPLMLPFDSQVCHELCNGAWKRGQQWSR